MQPPPERLGSFYLGALYDLAAGRRRDVPLHYDARDLTTHAVVVGMTGSGKTGLCVDLLEEAALDGVPALIVDPKGDLANLLLPYPSRGAADLAPWIDPAAARRHGRTVAEHAAAVSRAWRKGLADWGQGPERVDALAAAVDRVIYTPGSEAGVPVNIAGSLAAPHLDFAVHGEAIRQRITGTVAALLALVGEDADPTRSREAILLAAILEHHWRRDRDVSLADLIAAIQTPPVTRVGVFDVDTFFPPADRFDLAMAFNNLLASPAFAAWLTGTPLDVGRLLATPDGRPRHAILSLAHLDDRERMFFLTLLLEAVVTWMRRQGGTDSLRALLYIDEVFGFLPPVAAPPSKRPLLTLLKQARAFGLGVVLVTQNPADLDYKALTNAGTWCIGKLQAERDKQRVLEGLKGVSGGAAETDFDALISALDSRVFLLHDVHTDGPEVFQTRWAMSYLRGPLTLEQIRTLTASRRRETGETPPAAGASAPGAVAGTVADLASPTATPPAADPAAPPPGTSDTPPAVPPGVTVVHLPVTVPAAAAAESAGVPAGTTPRIRLCYAPAVAGVAEVRFVDKRRDIDTVRELVLLADPPESAVRNAWAEAVSPDLSPDDLAPDPAAMEPPPCFHPLPAGLAAPRRLKSLARALADHLYDHERLTLRHHPELDVVQQPGEPERDFLARLRAAARERRDAEVDALRRKHRRRLERLERRLPRLERELAEDRADYEARKRQEVLSLGESVLGMFLGRRRTRALSTAASRRRMTDRARMAIARTEEELEELRAEIDDLRRELDDAAAEIAARWEDPAAEVTELVLKPRRTDVDVLLTAVAWVPAWRVSWDDGDGERHRDVPATT